VCGACADACPERVFRFTHRFDRRVDAPAPASAGTAIRPSIPKPIAAYERTIP